MRPKPLIPILTATEFLLRCVVRECAVGAIQTVDNGVPAGSPAGTPALAMTVPAGPRSSHGRPSRRCCDVRPVRDVPERLDVVGLDVQVVEVEGVLPHVEQEQRDRCPARVLRLLVEELLDDELLAERVPARAPPSRSPGCRVAAAVKCAWNLSNAAEVTRRSPTRSSPVGLAAAVRREVGPEDRVVDVPAEVEREVLLELVHVREVAGVARLGQLLERGVRAGDVRLVVLVMVQLHDLAR